MTRSTIKPIIAVSAMLFCFAALFAQGNLNEQRSAYKPEATIEDLMELNKKLNGKLKNELEAGTNWKKIAHRGRLLAEIGNILTYQKDESETDWQSHAQRFRANARGIVAAAAAKDIEKARLSQRELFTTCKPCHKQYR